MLYPMFDAGASPPPSACIVVCHKSDITAVYAKRGKLFRLVKSRIMMYRGEAREDLKSR